MTRLIFDTLSLPFFWSAVGRLAARPIRKVDR